MDGSVNVATLGCNFLCECGQAMHKEGKVMRCLNKACGNYGKAWKVPIWPLMPDMSHLVVNG